MNSSDQTWNTGNETFPIFEILARKVGYLPLNQFSIPDLDTVVEFNTKSKVLLKLIDDGNPARTYLDLHILVLEQTPKLFKIWGEMLQKASLGKTKIPLQQAVFIAEGEDVDHILKDDWQKLKSKTVKLPISFAKGLIPQAGEPPNPST